jgi:ribonuclease HI
MRIPEAVFTDGGVILCNKSPYGGAWSWRAVAPAEGRPMMKGKIAGGVCADAQEISHNSGLVLLPEGRGKLLSNNVTEMMAAIDVLEHMPEGWSGTLYTDSDVTRQRLFEHAALNGLPSNVVARMKAALARVGEVKGVLLQGHPTKEDLRVGFGKKRGLPVSPHNLWCDKECGRLQNAWLEQHPEITYAGAKALRDALSNR